MAKAQRSLVTFGEYLRELREGRKFNKNRFAQALGIPFSTVNAWELHGATPNKKSLTSIMDVLELAQAERKKLTDLWLQIPGRRGKKVVERDAQTTEQAGGETPPARKDLEGLLTAALVPGRHTLTDGVAVLSALGEAALFIKERGINTAEARVWLDAAALLRERGTKVTAALLAVAMADPRARQDDRAPESRGANKKRSETTLER